MGRRGRVACAALLATIEGLVPEDVWREFERRAYAREAESGY